MIRILVADDHKIVRDGLKQILAATEGVALAGEAASGDEALALVKANDYDIAVVDMSMPGLAGIALIKRLKAEKPKLRVLVLSMHGEHQYAARALKAGASGYLLKTAELDEVVATVRSAAKGEAKLDPALATQVLSEFQAYQKAEVSEVYQPLTPREREILQLMSEGLPNKTIASRLRISERTVTTHVANIYSKLHVNNRVSAIQEAMRRRLLDFNR
jgi:DNA-binding NarL/FixJ family response regulator